jgi:protein-tyrosine phosphatase
MFDLSACHVERIDGGDYLLRWDGRHAAQLVSIYMSDDPEFFYRDAADFGPALLVTRGNEARLHNPEPGVRHYFLLQSEHGESVVLAERSLDLQGSRNFRDLGGYESTEGGRLRWGKLYRSSKLSGLTDADRQRVRRLGLTLVCDFRQAVEQELDPTHLGEDATHLLARLPVTPGSTGNFIDNLHNGIIAVDDAAGFMQDMNREFVTGQLPRYAEMFQLLLVGDHQVLIHCASGKDRTGFGAALILDVLGVPEESIVEDYLLSNRYLDVEAEMQRLAGQFHDASGRPVSEDVLRPLLEVRPEYIKACFDEIRRHYVSREHFYETALKLDRDNIERLRNRYLH